MDIPTLAERLNASASRFSIGRLQELRARLRSLSRVGSLAIFDYRTIHENYAFHVGGRKELQFNIGTETVNGARHIRHGVAFSLELSQSLPSIEPLLPKISRFNEYVRSQPEDFPGFSMWANAKKSGRCLEHGVTPIEERTVAAGTFIMLGRHVPEADVDGDAILIDFDRLIPLYAYVEGDGTQHLSPTPTAFRPGCPEFVAAAKTFRSERTIDVALRHKVLQNALFQCLSAEAGDSNVAIEHELDLGLRVDGAVRLGTQFAFYELKVAPSVQACVRPAIGQLLEYAHWPAASRARELIIVGECAADPEAEQYLRFLRDTFSLPIWYRQLSMSPLTLGPKI
jgi:hypothetical protein